MTSQERLRYRKKPTTESQSPTLQRPVQGLWARCVSPIVQTLLSSQDNTAWILLLRNHICHKWRDVHASTGQEVVTQEYLGICLHANIYIYDLPQQLCITSCIVASYKLLNVNDTHTEAVLSTYKPMICRRLSYMVATHTYVYVSTLKCLGRVSACKYTLFCCNVALYQ